MGREFVLPGVTEADFTRSNRLSVPMDENARPTAPYGTKYYRPIQVGFVDWKTAGESFIFPVTITEGEDEGMVAEMYPGASAKAAWKLRQVLDAIGVEYSTNEAGNVKFDPDDCENKLGTGVWEVVVGYTGGIVAPENKVKQLKFTGIMKAGYEPTTPESETEELV